MIFLINLTFRKRHCFFSSNKKRCFQYFPIPDTQCMVMFTKIYSIFDGKLMGKFSSPGAFGVFFLANQLSQPPFFFPALIRMQIHLVFLASILRFASAQFPQWHWLLRSQPEECQVVVCTPGWGWGQLFGGFQNNGTPKSSILIGFSIINHPFWAPIFGNTHIKGKIDGHRMYLVLVSKNGFADDLWKWVESGRAAWQLGQAGWASGMTRMMSQS